MRPPGPTCAAAGRRRGLAQFPSRAPPPRRTCRRRTLPRRRVCICRPRRAVRPACPRLAVMMQHGLQPAQTSSRRLRLLASAAQSLARLALLSCRPSSRGRPPFAASRSHPPRGSSSAPRAAGPARRRGPRATRPPPRRAPIRLRAGRRHLGSLRAGSYQRGQGEGTDTGIN